MNLLAQRARNSRAGVIASRDASVPLRRHTTVSLVARSRGLHREPVSEGAPLDWTGGPPRHEALHGVVLSNRPPNFYTAAMRVAVSRRSDKSRWRMDTLRGIGGDATPVDNTPPPPAEPEACATKLIAPSKRPLSSSPPPVRRTGFDRPRPYSYTSASLCGPPAKHPSRRPARRAPCRPAGGEESKVNAQAS